MTTNTSQHEYLLSEWRAHNEMYAQLQSLFPLVVEVANELRATIARGGKILIMGNGGSAADSQHIAAEIVGRYKKERRGWPAIALTKIGRAHV